jgi:hypothetical protein
MSSPAFPDQNRRISYRLGRAQKAAALASTAGLLACGAAGAYAAETEDIRGPDVTIIEQEDRTVHEYRQGGVLRMVQIVPSWGKPYYLVPRDQTAGQEDLERADALLPNWVIVEF